jgi:hypothetical protein
MIAALYVQADGVYSGLSGVDPWPIDRDARQYPGPHPVVAHPDCKRWGRFWHGSPRNPHQFQLGDDDGQFAAALASVRQWGGVLEHPACTRAWEAFGLIAPPRLGGWVGPDRFNGWTCHIEQGFYGHVARKATWLYACRTALPRLRWGAGEQRLDPVVVERHGYAHARRQGMTSRIGGKDKTKIREATPIPFRDLLIAIAQSVPLDTSTP